MSYGSKKDTEVTLEKTGTQHQQNINNGKCKKIRTKSPGITFLSKVIKLTSQQWDINYNIPFFVYYIIKLKLIIFNGSKVIVK